MFNLFVTAKEGQWDKPVWEIEIARAIQKDEYTDAGIAKKLNSFDEESINELKSYPCLFAYESYLNKDVRFGRLKNIKKRGNKLRVDYELVEVSQRVSSSKIEKLKLELDCATEGELNRTHWAVKDVDLLKVLITAEILDENIDRDILDKLRGYVSVGPVNISDKNFEWLKNQTFCPEVILNLEINSLRKSIAPKATDSDWEYVRRCLKSKDAIYEKEKIGIIYEVAMDILGDIKKLTKFKNNFVFDLLQINGKSYGDSGAKQYLLISTQLFMIAFDDFSPIAVAQNYYNVLTKVLTKYSGRQTLTNDEFNAGIDENVSLFKSNPVKDTAIKFLTIAGLLEKQITSDGKVNFNLDFSPGNYDFEEWLKQLFEYKFQIRNPEYSKQLTEENPGVKNVFSKNDYTDVVLKILGMAADLRNNSKTPEDNISTNLLFSAALISSEPNDQRNSASAILDYLKEDYKSKSRLKTDMHAMDLMKLSSRYGINNRLIVALPVDEIDFEKLSIGSKFALDIALNKYARQISPGSKADLRHLVAALLFSDMPNHEMGIQKFIFKTTQINRDGLKNIFMDYISATRSKEFEGWQKVLELQTNDEKTKKETVPYHDDNPTSEDLLQRKTLAEVLSQRIKEIREKNIKQKRGSFLVHLGGTWGSGKSTFVNFLQDLMEKNKVGEPWITVHFNAWQHQRLSPPWWYLMDTVYKTGLRNLKFCDRQKLRFLEYRWRWSVNSLLSWVVLILYTILVFLLIFEFSPNAFWADVDFIGRLMGKPEDSRSEILIKSLTAIAAITGYLIVWANFLTPNSAKDAGKFVKSSSDPLRELHEHFFNMVKEIKRPICIFIDDLDRCQGKYVVELLEGIQTLFRDANITYVIIADINWLCACYSNEYKDFKAVVDEPGKPLGYYFLDKTFQLSFSLPLIGNTAKSTYWKHLIEANEDKTIKEDKRRVYEEKAVSDFKNVAKEVEIGTMLEKYIKETEINHSDDTEELIRAYRRAAVLKFNEPGTLAQTAHVLQDFAPLLESNPRFMKRLVNEYSMDWTIDKLQGRNIQREKIARWAILKLRWPLLAEYLLNHPEAIKLIVNGKIEEENIPTHLKQLFKDPKVLCVIQGGDVGGKLDELTIKQIANTDI